MNKQFVALVSVRNSVLHVVGPFPTEQQAFEEGRKVAQGVDMFAPVGSDDDDAHVTVKLLFKDLAHMVQEIRS